MKQNIILEICCGSAEDAVNAFNAGADRIELNSALDFGGLTPSAGTVKAALENVDIPVICMVRPRPGGFCYSEYEFESMLYDAGNFTDMGAAGAAFGCLTPSGKIDYDRCCRIIEALKGAEAVFHRAFDAMTQPFEEALELLVKMGVKRILTSGGCENALEGAENISLCRQYASGKLELLPGGGVRPHNFREILGKTGCGQLHCTFHKEAQDSSAIHNKKISFDAGPSGVAGNIKIIDKEGLKSFTKAIKAHVASIG